jgi:type IV pilus assembly protein PilA
MPKRVAGFSLLELMTLLIILGVLAATAIPAFVRYVRRSKTSEAMLNMRKLFDSSVSYYEEEHGSRLGGVLPKQFPASTVLTPTTPCCGQPADKCAPTVSDWKGNATWDALNFAIDDPHFYRYEYVSTGTESAAAFTARALGDLNCDGTLATFERTGSALAGGGVSGGSGLYKHHSLE